MFRRNEEYILRQIAGEYFVIPTGKTASKMMGMITFSESSAHIWELLAVPRTLEELVENTLDAYEVSKPHAEADIRRLLDKLTALDMLVAQ